MEAELFFFLVAYLLHTVINGFIYHLESFSESFNVVAHGIPLKTANALRRFSIQERKKFFGKGRTEPLIR
jgi:hypothetical protein